MYRIFLKEIKRAKERIPYYDIHCKSIINNTDATNAFSDKQTNRTQEIDPCILWGLVSDGRTNQLEKNGLFIGVGNSSSLLGE